MVNMLWSELFWFSKKCKHDKVPLDVEYYYCPDCGELVKNHWYIVRCACCGSKERATVFDGEVKPDEDFCKNCGSTNYVVEEIDKINCININYAVVIRKAIVVEQMTYTQSWIENAMQITGYKQKLLK